MISFLKLPIRHRLLEAAEMLLVWLGCAGGSSQLSCGLSSLPQPPTVTPRSGLGMISLMT